MYYSVRQDIDNYKNKPGTRGQASKEIQKHYADR